MSPHPRATMKNSLRPLLAATLALSVAAASLPAQIAQHVVRTQIAGIDLVAYKTGVKDVVYLTGSLPAGDNKAPADNVMIPTLVGGMLSRGTTKHTKAEIADQLDAVGASISFSVGSQTVDISARCLAKDVPLVVSLLAEQLRSPAFSEEEFGRLKQQTLGNLKRALESTDFRATETFTRAVYGPGHPNRDPSIEEQTAATQAATLDALKQFHAAHYGPAHLTLVAAGDLDVGALQAEIGKQFAGWTGGTAPLARPANPPTDAPRDQTVFMADKTSVNIVLGQATGLRYGDPDYFALRTATAVLGSGFTGRLMANVRDKEGLTYGIGASHANDTFTDGDFRITATFSPALLEKGIASTKRQLDRWYQEGITADELARRQDNLVGSFQVGLATTGGLASNLLAAIQRGKDASWLDQYPGVIRGLTLDQVNGAVKKHLNPAQMVLVKAGTVSEAPAKN